MRTHQHRRLINSVTRSRAVLKVASYLFVFLILFLLALNLSSVGSKSTGGIGKKLPDEDQTNLEWTSRKPAPSFSVRVQVEAAIAACGAEPMMTKDEREAIASFLRHNDKMLEWGSGRSSCIWSHFVKELVSIEHNAPWAETVRSALRNNQRLYAVPRNAGFENYQTTAHRPPSPLAAYSDYVNFPASLNQRFDVIFIDGRARPQCALEALRLLQNGGIVIVHDYNSKFPYRGYYNILGRWYDRIFTAHTVAVFKPKGAIIRKLRQGAAIDPGHLPNWWFMPNHKYDFRRKETIIGEEPFELVEELFK